MVGSIVNRPIQTIASPKLNDVCARSYVKWEISAVWCQYLVKK
jgi:hypothetical protein